MQYFISYLNREQYGAISIIKNPHSIHIDNLELYKNADDINYNKLMKSDEIIVEPDFQLKSFPNYTKQEVLILIYNYYYLQFLHQAINNKLLKYSWLNINCTDFYNYMTPQLFKKQGGNHLNKYLNNFDTAPDNLAYDILQNGMYFPLGFKLIDGKKFICLGRHRFYSLQKNKDLFKNKKFLFLDFSPIEFIWDSIPYTQCKKLLQPIGKPTNCYVISENYNGIFKTLHNEALLFWNYFRIFSDQIANEISHYSNIIKPHPIFNSEVAWETFINQPFTQIKALENFTV